MSRPWKYAVIAFLGTVPTMAGCRAATDAFGTDALAVKTNADAFALALEQRFTRVVRTPKYSQARMRMARYAFAPSKLVADTALWTSMRSTPIGAERRLDVSGAMLGSMRDGYYTFTPQARATLAAKTGDSRHRISLSATAVDDEWAWTTSVENAIGIMPPARATDIVRALLASAEQSPAVIRADYRRAVPHTATALGRMFAVDSLMTARQPDGSMLVTLHLLMSDERLKREFPELANYVRKYMAPATLAMQLQDPSGAEWMSIHMQRLRMVIRFRSQRGELQPIAGAFRKMPDTLQLRVSGTAKLSFFTVGASNIVGELVHVRTPAEHGWAMRFTKEPDWQLPLIGERLLRSPLRRPFEGTGIQFRLSLAASATGQTVLVRSASAVVKESAIMRFLGNLGFTAMSDYAGKVEEEENRFVAEWFAAMRRDVAALP